MDTRDELEESHASSLVVKKVKRSLSEEDQATKDRHDALLKKHIEKTNFSGIELKRNSMRNNRRVPFVLLSHMISCVQ